MRRSVSRCSSTGRSPRSATSASPRSTVSGRAQLVADVGQEQHAHLVEPLQPAVGVLELAGAPRHLVLEPGLHLEQLLALRLEPRRRCC